MGLRNFIEKLQENGQLTKITKAVSTEYELAGVINALGEKPVYSDLLKSRLPGCGWTGFLKS